LVRDERDNMKQISFVVIGWMRLIGATRLCW
jgi:hypothetical protein